MFNNRAMEFVLHTRRAAEGIHYRCMETPHHETIGMWVFPTY